MESENISATLVCWACGRKKSVILTREPQFAFEIGLAAQDVGWIGAHDVMRSRVLLFCSDRCRDSQITKMRGFRARPKIIPQEVAVGSEGLQSPQ